ncbi:SDR family NAD(P)-dependent oxidoreductase [Candidatus Caldatribacterium sp.]|uniref:SDR family NAD(P)-dependent oxidoreductase n=1 Tax=Candidatus Caldatribacterium sp. TaxID=2282143 RepID=UPI002992AB77|nr:glucose 1-dehydrogenase [Candidatus Caldatribacterium sp.]MDW8081258.1 glucose 1-dehydrogenase [Candidatus Calescibacterium sp.]
MDLGFAGKVVIVTGGGAGIGEATVRLFAEEGAKVVIADVDPVRGKKLEDELTARGYTAAFYEVDVACGESVARMTEEVIKRFGTVDVLVNNAGVYAKGDVLAFKEEDFERLVDINVKGVVLCTQSVGRHMVEKRDGVIVNVASEAGLVAIANQMVYNLTKAAVISITKSCAVDFAPFGVRVNCVCPGTTYTPLVEEALKREKDPEGARRRLEESRPLRRLGKPEEIGAAILFLASPRVGYATGAVLSIDGGYTVW